MLVLVLISAVFILWLWSRRNSNKDEPPVCSGSKILIGHALQYAGDSIKLWESVKSFSKEALLHGGVVKTTVGPRVLYILSDPEDFSTVANACLQKDALYDFAKSWLGDGLVTSTPSKWKIHRKLLNPAFSQSVLDSFIDVFNNQSRCLVDNLKMEVGKGPFDIWAYSRQNTLETLLSSLKRKQEECIKVLRKMSNTILNEKKGSFFNNISKQKEVEEKTKGQKFKPFMDLLLELSCDTNVFTDRVIREHVDTIIVSGHDTTATVIMFCTLLVGSHPRVQRKIQEELNHIFGEDDRDVIKQDLAQLVYLEAVIKETMRVYPVVPIIGRYLHKNVKLRNCTLSKEKAVIMSIYGISRHSMWGPDVEEFRPERWLDSSAVSHGPSGLASFGIGRRICIGQAYAMTSMKITLVHIYRNYTVHGDHTKLKLKMDVMLKPVSGYNITFEKRM